MVHGELKLKLWKSMLELESFTVGELAEHADVARRQTYGELASLQKQKIIISETIQSAAKHRPLNLYRLTQDADLRRQFIETNIAPRVRGAQSFPDVAIDGPAGEDARSAHIALDEVNSDLSALEEHARSFFRRLPNDSTRQLEKMRARLGEARSFLESAIYRLGIPDDRSATPNHIVTLDAKRFQAYRTRVNELHFIATQHTLTLEAQRSFTEDILSVALEHTPATSSSVVQLAKRVWTRTANDVLRQMLSIFLTELEALKAREPKGHPEEYSKFVASKAVRWCSSASMLSECLNRVTTDNETNEYNRVNALFLQGDHKVAFASWKRWTKQHISNRSLHLTGFQYLQYPGVAVGIFDDADKAKDWSRQIEQLVGPTASISTASFAAVRFPTLDQTPAIPTLFDPKSSPNEIRLAESLTMDLQPLFASGQLSQRFGLPGIPEIRLATVLFSIGVKSNDAWHAAERLTQGKVLVVVCSANAAHLEPAFRESNQRDASMRDVRFYGEPFRTPALPQALGTSR